MPLSSDIIKCKKCGVEVLWADLRKHNNELHGGYAKHVKVGKTAESVVDRFETIKKELQALLLDIDGERNRITKRLLELDTLHAKYSKLL